MADVTISDLEQIAELTDGLKIPCEGNTGNTSSLTLSQLLGFLQAPVEILNVSGTGTTYTLNPPRINTIYRCDLASVTSESTVTINLPAGSLQRESQIIMKVNNPNLATIRIAGLTLKLSMLNLTLNKFQLILDYDQTQGAWVAGTLPIESIEQ